MEAPRASRHLAKLTGSPSIDNAQFLVNLLIDLRG
jgi:hypothetical protein